MKALPFFKKRSAPGLRMLPPLVILFLLAGWRAGAASSGPLRPAFPARQVHLDFHTSQWIPEVGARFDPIQFQQALKLGRVNWINLFAKCHHSWSYYPTAVGRPHPNLKFDLLGRQIEACHEIGVRCPFYFTVGWSATDAEEHPEWCVRTKDGSMATINWDEKAAPTDRRPIVSWKFLCPSGAYRELILRQTEELCRRYPVDGFWYDINNASPPCYCANCRQAMAGEGVDVANDTAVAKFNARKWKSFFSAARAMVARYHPQATVFFNGTTVLSLSNLEQRMFADNTQQELEDLPTTWGGYDKLALRAKYFHNFGQPLVAMSGKFHTMWGEFGGFKHRDAIRYEAAAMLANGVACNFGDQLHPSGEMDLETYRNIGHGYSYVETLEDYAMGGKPVSRLGVWLSGTTADDEGVSSMLQELHEDFVVVDPDANWAGLDVIILTGGPGLKPAQAELIQAFVKRGGGLLVLGESAMNPERTGFLLEIGARYLGPARYQEDYLVVGQALRTGLVSTPFLNYEAALRVQPEAGAEVLARLREPYFNRTYAQYCSHQNTPYQLEHAPHPGAVQNGRVLFLPHRLGKLYHEHGARLHRDFFGNALHRIYRQPMIHAPLPSAGRVTLLQQPERRRYVAHLLYAPPLARGRCQVIEDLPELRDVAVTLRINQNVKGAYLIPGKKRLSLRKSEGAVRVKVPAFQTHAAIVFDY